MKRAVGWLLATMLLVLAIRFGGAWLLTASITHEKNYEAHSMHEGHVIVDEIKSHDPSINATWTTDDHAQPNIVIRNVFDRGEQDMILSWAKPVKAQGRVQRHITVDFQKEIPHSSIPDTVLRSESF